VITEKAFEAAQALFPTIADKLDFFVGESVTLSDKRGVATRQELLDCQLELARLLENATQGWKFEVLVAGLLGTKIRERADVPDVVLAYYGNALISDSLKLRHLAVRATSFILAVTKQRPLKELYGFNDGGGVVHLTIPITAADQSKAVDSLPRPWSPRSQIDKYPHCYSTADSAKFEREEVFNSTVFVDKNFVGWSLFPQQIRTYPSLKEQPILAPTASMSLMWDVVSRAGFFDVHCDLFSQDKADGTAARFSEAQAELYKGLARNHGVKFLELVRPRIEHLLAKTDTDGVSETTAKFRCAGELIAGIVRGSKHWRHDELQTMWAFIIPTLESTLPRVEHHTIGNFSSMLRYCVYDRDPRRFYPLCELFFRPFSLAVDQGDTSFEQ
jgi:proteasome activator subunit 4